MSQTFTERVAGNRTGGDLIRWLIVGIAAVIIAAGLFALGRWTAPSTELDAEASAQPLNAAGLGPPGTIDPAVMPSKAVQQVLERIYLGTPLASDRTQATGLGPPGTIDPAVMPSKAVQQVLERIYLGTPLASDRTQATGLGPPGTIDPAVMPSKAVQQVLERIYLGTPLASDRTQATGLGPPDSIDAHK